MKTYLKRNGIKLLAVMLVVVLFVSAGKYLMAGRAGALANISAYVGIPLRRAAMSVTVWLEDIYGYMYDRDKLLAENEYLRIQLAEAQELARQGAAALKENDRLRGLIGLKERHSDFEFETAKIVSWNPSNWASTFTISKGEQHGVKLGDCVVTEYGALVGQVIELGDIWAVVRSVIDVGLNIGALVGEAGNAAMVVGEFTLMHQGCTKLTYLTEGAQPLRGDVILTSGKGGQFPQGLVIGRIADVGTEAGVLYGVIKPDCDLDRLSQVFVIKSFEVVE